MIGVGADELFVSVVDDNISWGGGCCTIFGETTLAKMWLFSDSILGEVDRLAQEKRN